MSQHHHVGLPSAFEGTSQTPQAPSAVSTLASRFSASSTADSAESKVSEKLSSIASRFGTTVADADINPRNKKLSAKPAAAQSLKPEPVSEERPTFGEITKRFASGTVGQGKAGQDDQPQNMFAAAADAWGRREAETRPKAEGKVSAFKREIESAKKSTNQKDVKDSLPLPSDGVVEEKPEGVGNIASKFESGKQDKPKADEAEPLVDRFQSAAKIFAGAEDSKKKEEGEVDPANTKFADAAKLFGGSGA